MPTSAPKRSSEVRRSFLIGMDLLLLLADVGLTDVRGGGEQAGVGATSGAVVTGAVAVVVAIAPGGAAVATVVGIAVEVGVEVVEGKKDNAYSVAAPSAMRMRMDSAKVGVRGGQSKVTVNGVAW